MAYTSVVPTLDTNHVKVTSVFPSGDFVGYYSCDVARSLTGEWDHQCWVANGATNQRFHMDLGSAQVIKRIYYENGHWFGNTTSSVQNFTLWGSNSSSSFNELTYGTDTGWTQLTTAQSTFDQHVAADTPDPKYILVTNDTAYQYYAIKCADNYGNGVLMALRRILLQTEDGGGAFAGLDVLYIGGAASGMSVYTGGATAPTGYASVYPPAHNSTYVKVTSAFNGSWLPENATDPAKSLTGAAAGGNEWISGNGQITNQSFHIDLGSGQIIKRIYFENGHEAGTDVFGGISQGVKNFTFWGTDNAAAFADTTYATDTNWTQLTTSISLFQQHALVDASDPQYAIVTNTTAYRYYRIKFADHWSGTDYMKVRRIELQVAA